MGQAMVRAIRPRDGSTFDPEQLGDLMARMAEMQDQMAVGNLLDELALKLSQIGRAWRCGRFELVATCCREVADIAAELRVEPLARVARTALMLTSQDDSVALAANLGRLLRLGEALLTTVWDLQDASV